MTEDHWNCCTDPVTRLDFLRHCGKAADRKIRLFAVASCRCVWQLLGDERSRNAVEIAERFADNAASMDELGIAFSCAANAYAYAVAAQVRRNKEEAE